MQCAALAAALVALSSTLQAQTSPAAQTEPGAWVGTLEPDPTHAAELHRAGARLVTVGVTWAQFEPTDGEFSATYRAKIRQQIATFRAAGMRAVLSPGLQYPPTWVTKLPHAAYINQYGDAYEDPQPGASGANAVFSDEVRARQARFIQRLFADLGTDFAAVRLGWGFWGEVGYPKPVHKGHTNCYWGFDPRAQGTRPGLPDGVDKCPVPGWVPGTASPDHESARRFADWYMKSLQNYHDWQVTTVRHEYAGKLAMLYPSWGIRPGQLEAAVRGDLGGQTSPEKNGEIQRGFDFAPMIAGVHDKDVIVYTTWLDANPRFGNDAAADPTAWCPAHFLASLARQHDPPLEVWGENTGGGGRKAMVLSFDRARSYHLLGVMWAFEKDLFTPEGPAVSDLANCIRGAPPGK